MSWELLPPWSSSALQEQKSPEGNIAHACVAGRPRITGEGGGGKGAHGGPCGHPGRTEQGARDFFAQGTTPCRSLFLNTPSPPPPAPALTVFTTCLSDSLGCSRGQNKIPPCSFDLQDTETIVALRTKMAFYAWHLRSRALTGTKERRQPLRTKSDPTTTSKTELQESKVQRCVLKCQMYFKGLEFPFSPAFRIVNDTNTRGLLSYSSNSPNFSLKSSIYYICQEKKKKKTPSF